MEMRENSESQGRSIPGPLSSVFAEMLTVNRYLWVQ